MCRIKSRPVRNIQVVLLEFSFDQSCKDRRLVIGVPRLLLTLPRLSIFILSKEIEPVPVAKDVGVNVDQSLSYTEHTSKVVSRCVYKLVQIYRIKHLLDSKTFFL